MEIWVWTEWHQEVPPIFFHGDLEYVFRTRIVRRIDLHHKMWGVNVWKVGFGWNDVEKCRRIFFTGFWNILFGPELCVESIQIIKSGGSTCGNFGFGGISSRSAAENFSRGFEMCFSDQNRA